MAKPLVIVESPAKARTIAGFLGDDFIVESSVGHIRDLPQKAADIPKAYKAETWARLGVDTDNDFKPLYVVNPDKKSQVATLKKHLKNASELYLATDEDREGEAIAWHLLEVLNPTIPTKRMVFHEITRSAIEEAMANPRELDRRMVDAQEVRRVLDRLYGYEVSPVLWKKVGPRLSAGRVQSPSVRMIVQRERERMAFRSASYWDIDGQFEADGEGVASERRFSGGLVLLNEQRLASGKDFDSTGNITRDDVVLLDETSAGQTRNALLTGDPTRFVVRSVESKPYRRKPPPPFMTSTIQQEAGRKLRFSSARTMSAAQRLYENGYITYMRTDSTTLSATALTAARSQITEKYGTEYLPAEARVYSKKVKNAQEAHEAIRPAGDEFKMPAQVSSEVGNDEARLYELIWMRTIASQMKDAEGQSVQVRLGPAAGFDPNAEFASSGKTITFPGFLRAYVEGTDDPDGELEDQERFLPTMSEGDQITVLDLEAKGHETQPPARFTEASLIRRLEELGVGRPSTYASIISTILDRGYVWKKGTALIPSFTAFAVVTLLEQHFPELVDYAFTARMEDDLDSIARGDQEMVPWLSNFYFGQAGRDGQPAEGETPDLSKGSLGLKYMVSDIADIDARAINSIPLGEAPDGDPVVARVGRYGPYLQKGEQTASIPDDTVPDELTVERAIELLDAPSNDRVLGQHPETGLDVWVKAGRFGPYVQMGPAVEGEKPDKTSSLFKDMSPEDLDFDTAVKLLSIPRTVGPHPETGEIIEALNGRFGPYLKMGKETRSIESEQQIFDVTLEEALAIIAKPKQRGRGAAKPPLKELGKDPVSGEPMVVKDGRFGPYVTDGEYNASLRKGDSIEELTDERASELLAERRAKGPAKKKKAKKKAKSTKKKATKKKATKKKATKKKAAPKKAAAKKTDEPGDNVAATDSEEPF